MAGCSRRAAQAAGILHPPFQSCKVLPGLLVLASSTADDERRVRVRAERAEASALDKAKKARNQRRPLPELLSIGRPTVETCLCRVAGIVVDRQTGVGDVFGRVAIGKRSR